MILPTKHISEKEALIGLGATMLAQLTSPITVSDLWDQLKRDSSIGTFERFALTADFLYLIGAIDLKDGLIVRSGL